MLDIYAIDNFIVDQDTARGRHVDAMSYVEMPTQSHLLHLPDHYTQGIATILCKLRQ